MESDDSEDSCVRLLQSQIEIECWGKACLTFFAKSVKCAFLRLKRIQR